MYFKNIAQFIHSFIFTASNVYGVYSFTARLVQIYKLEADHHCILIQSTQNYNATGATLTTTVSIPD